MSRRLIVDETKAGDYLLVAAAILTKDVNSVRRAMRSALPSRQNSVHFKNESDVSRRRVLAALLEQPIETIVYRVPRTVPELAARETSLRALARDAIASSVEQITIDRDDSVLIHDRRWLTDEFRQLQPAMEIRFYHQRRHEDLLLGIPDAIAWCLQRGRPWVQRVEPLISQRIGLG